jgi:hypothetical protein
MAWNDFCAALNTFSMQAMVQGNGICWTRLCPLHHGDAHGPIVHLSDKKLPMAALIQQDYTGKKKEGLNGWWGGGGRYGWTSLAQTWLQHLGQPPNWKAYKLVSWKSYDTHHKVYKQVYNIYAHLGPRLEVEYLKIAHA